MSVYPKASAPASENAIAAANARADRWLKRYEALRSSVLVLAADEAERAADLKDDHSATVAHRLRALAGIR